MRKLSNEQINNLTSQFYELGYELKVDVADQTCTIREIGTFNEEEIDIEIIEEHLYHVQNPVDTNEEVL